MTKGEILALIARINTPREAGVKVSSETTRWKALREGETIDDPGVFPLLREIIGENEGKGAAKREIRSAAYFLYGRVMERACTPDAFPFFLGRLEAETDKHLLHGMLERVKDWHHRAGILLPPEADTAPVCRLTRDDRWLVRQSALHALSACPGAESREALRYWLGQEDEAKYKYEMWYAAIAMQSVGEAADIPLLERLLKSRRRDLKITAQNAIRQIGERAEAAAKEVTL